MANELTLAINGVFTKNGVSFSESFSSTFTVSGDPATYNVVSVATSDGVLDLGAISSLGYLFFRNLDVTNFLSVGYTSGTYFLKLKPGEFAALRAGAGLTAVHAKADTGACLLEYMFVSD